MLIAGNKSDLQNSNLHSEELTQKYHTRFPIVSISAKNDDNLEELKRVILKSLEIIRVHTKSPGVKPNLNDPMIMKKGSTMKDAGEAVHKDFRAKLKYALVWGSGKFDGQRVSPDHVLQDNDIIELHI
jgi:ribosome-interacting GTPase 1